MTKVLVIAPPPTPNGDLHIGHLSGPYLRADIYTRYLKMRGIEAYYLTGVDEHQSYVAFKAEQLGLTALETADKFSADMRATLRAAHIEVDHYARPSQSLHHTKLVLSLFERLYSQGKLIAKEEPCLYCETCQQYLYEAYVHGKCPHCGAQAGGNACEVCGRPNACLDLLEAACSRCQGPPAVRVFTRLFFPLSQYEMQLRSYYKSVEMSPRMRVLCEQMLAAGLPDIPVSHPSTWGMMIPSPGFEGQRLYVWFEMAAGELAATQELCERVGLDGGWQQFWQSDEAEVVKFCGFDNSYFYAVLFPAIQLAYNSRIRPPKVFLTNEFYRLDGLKFSTSRNHVIWGRDLLADVSADMLRFYLAYSGPETEQTNFNLHEFEKTVRRELHDGIQLWLSDLGDKINTEFGDIAPAPATAAWTPAQQQFYQKLQALICEAASAYESRMFSPQHVTRVLVELIHAAQDFSQEQSHRTPLDSLRLERQTSISLELVAARTLQMLSAPIMPDFSARLWHDLGLSTTLSTRHWENEPPGVPAGVRIHNLHRAYFPESISSSIALTA
jgi:methionyl-tRNA synthetase